MAARNPAQHVPIPARMKTSANAAIAVPDAGSRDERISISSRRVSLVEEVESKTLVPAPIWEPAFAAPSSIPTTDEVLHRRPPPGALADEIVRTLVASLTRPLRADESHFTGNENRERELKGLFALLEPMEALQLRRRLDADRNDDPLAVAFRRIVAQRRERLRAFLESPRRHLG
jgi:hypothetical protein